MAEHSLVSALSADDKSEDTLTGIEGQSVKTSVRKLLSEGQGVKFISRFACKLLKTMLTEEKNFVVSPLISLCAVGTVIVGSNGSSLEELSKAVLNVIVQNIDEEMALMNNMRAVLSSALSDKLDYIKAPSYLYVKDAFKISRSFQECASFYFGVYASQSEFDHRAVTEMNERINIDTDNNIGPILKKLEEGVQMLLINCTFFCGVWNQGFFEMEPLTFFNDNDTKSEIDFMHGYGKFKIGCNNDLKCHIIEIPYKVDNTKMVILMPDKGVDFHGFVEMSSKCEYLMNLLTGSNLKFVNAQVWLPKFRSEFIVSLKSFYRALGVNEIFDSTKADFSRVVDSKNSTGLFLADIVEKIVFEVKQHGSRTMSPSKVPHTEVFKCNRPFLYFVVSNYKEKQVILLQGAVKLL